MHVLRNVRLFFFKDPHEFTSPTCFFGIFVLFEAVLRTHEILVYGSGSADPHLWLMDPDPAIFVSDLQDKKSGSGSVSLTEGSGCGSGRPKNIWILRIRILIRIRNTSLKSSWIANLAWSFSWILEEWGVHRLLALRRGTGIVFICCIYSTLRWGLRIRINWYCWIRIRIQEGKNYSQKRKK